MNCDTINSCCDLVGDSSNEVTRSMPTQCETTTEAPNSVIEVEETDDTSGVPSDNSERQSHGECKSASVQCLNTQENNCASSSSNVLDRNQYLTEEIQLPDAPDLSDFCEKTSRSGDSDSSLEEDRNLPMNNACSGADVGIHDIVFEHEDLNDGIETVEVMTISEFIGCTDIDDTTKHILDPKAKKPWDWDDNSNPTYPRNYDYVIPKTKVCSGEDMPVTGATGIQTITRKDSETDNVVVIIRPRSRSPSERRPTRGDQRSLSTRRSMSMSDHRTVSPNYIECSAKPKKASPLLFPKRIHSDPESACCSISSDRLTQNSDMDSTEIGEPKMFQTSTPQEMTSSETGARRKRWVRHNSTDTDVTNEITNTHDSLNNSDIDIDRLDPEWDAEDKLIWELLSSMKSVTKRPDEHSDTSKNDTNTSFENAEKMIDQTCSDAIDSNNTSLISSELNNSLDSEKERERLISKKLQRRQAGGITCITFLSPGHKRKMDTFTPIQRKESLKLDAKEFFQKGFESSRKDLSVNTKDTDQSDNRTISSSKLHSPKLFLS
ncbi:uncharacterized protein [Argopecten irradians]|uniref:uncharacterized protein n=1 Tax=Argopecten irradians TaxID=31199 RepID=UPI0037118523